MEQPTGHASGMAVQGAPRPADTTCAAVELDAMRVALDQLSRLLDDAVVRLIASFETVAAASAAQLRQVRAGAAAGTVATAAAQCGRRIDDGVADAITALQFHDIASQLLEQIAARVDRVGDLTTAKRAQEVPWRLASGKESGQGHRASRPSQVTQVDLLPGTIELF